MHCLLAICVCVLVSVTRPATSHAQHHAANDTLGFWVIGHDAPTRQWASEWIERAMRSASSRSPVPLLGWRQGLPRFLDVDAPGALSDPPPAARRGGPAESISVTTQYPWDMTREVSVGEMIEILHNARAGVVVQVVVRRFAGESDMAADSVYGLEALAIAEKGLGAASTRVVTLTASSGVVADRTLREASHQLGVRLAAMWVDLMAAGPVRAR